MPYSPRTFHSKIHPNGPELALKENQNPTVFEYLGCIARFSCASQKLSHWLPFSDWTTLFWIGQSDFELGNQHDGFWLAHENLGMHPRCSNTVGFWFSLRASSSLFGWIFDWKVRGESCIFDLNAAKFECRVMRFSEGKLLRHLNPFKTRLPPLSFYALL